MEDGSTIENFDGSDGFFGQVNYGESKASTTKDTKVHDGKDWA
jgi:hypothetical protein